MWSGRSHDTCAVLAGVAHSEGRQGAIVGADAIALHGLVQFHRGAGLLGSLTGCNERIVDMQCHGDTSTLHPGPHPHCLLPITLQAAHHVVVRKPSKADSGSEVPLAPGVGGYYEGSKRWSRVARCSMLVSQQLQGLMLSYFQCDAKSRIATKQRLLNEWCSC